MSFPYCTRLWIATKKDLKSAVVREQVLRQLEPIRDRNYAHRLVGNIFARYIVLCNNLSQIYDQTLQAQKRVTIEKILISSTQRMLELQKEMQKIEMSEFVYLDDALVELKMTPQNVEFLCPFYFPKGRDAEVQQLIDEVPKAVEVETKRETMKGVERFRKVLTTEEKHRRELIEKAVNVIKSHEKAKQARVASLNAKLFPDLFKSKRREFPTVKYEFMHQPDQIPLHKIKRKKYKTNFYKPEVNVAKFVYYEPPKIRLNYLGQKVIDTHKKSEIVMQPVVDQPDSDDDERMKINEEFEKREAQLEIEESNNFAAAAAARVIQRCFRRYQSRKALNRQRLRRLDLSELILKPDDSEKLKKKAIENRARINRRERKKEFDERLLAAIQDEKARIVKFKAHQIMEDISDDIRQWFREFYDEIKDFHKYPEEFEGGTILVLRGETITPEEFLIEKNKTPAEKAKEKLKKKAAIASKKKNDLTEKKLELARIKLEKKQGPTWEFADKRFDSKHFGA